MAGPAVTTELLTGGRLLRLTLDRPKANIVNAEMIRALQTALDAHAAHPELAAVSIAAAGPNFSFGASVEEHLPGSCAEMLRDLHRLLLTMLDYPVPILVSVRGFCLGGGLELACSGSLIFAAPDATFGQPEIQLAVFAPAASCLLPLRIGQAQADDLLFSGRTIHAAEALRIGLINEVTDDPDAAAVAYFDRQLAPRSSFALRQAVRAAHADVVPRMRERFAAVERRYLDELMHSHDAVEGLNAFIQKRQPQWEHR